MSKPPLLIDPNAPRAKCEGCLQEYFAIQLSRFGRHAHSPMFCLQCATHEFERLRKKIFGEDKVEGRKIMDWKPK